MIDVESVITKLQALEEYTDELRELSKLTADDLKKTTRDRWAVEHGLLLAIECLLDIGSHIIAEDKLGRPNDYTEVIDILGRKGVIPNEFAEEIRGMAGFRNILVHEYTRVDLKVVHQKLDDGPRQFDEFRVYVQRYLA